MGGESFRLFVAYQSSIYTFSRSLSLPKIFSSLLLCSSHDLSLPVSEKFQSIFPVFCTGFMIGFSFYLCNLFLNYQIFIVA